MSHDISRIAAWLQPRECLLDADVPGRTQVLELLAERVAQAHGIEPGLVYRALWRRELSGSTALGNGFALPHAAIIGIAEPLTLFMRPKASVDFDATDRQPVSQVLAILAPVGGSKTDHLQLLALVAQLFSDRSFRAALDAVPDAAAADRVFQAGITRMTAALQAESQHPA